MSGKHRRKAARGYTAPTAKALAFAGLGLILGCGFDWGGAFTSADDVVFVDPKTAVIDARTLMQEAREGTRDAGMYRPDELPQSLRIPKLLYAYIFDDHLSLVLARNPDWNVGARIWSDDATREHADQPTKYEEIFFYDYTNDLPESPTNIK